MYKDSEVIFIEDEVVWACSMEDVDKIFVKGFLTCKKKRERKKK